jgi:uncharacterized protein (DUF4415 family)
LGTRFKHIPPLTDEEEAQIQRQIASDPDAPEATDEELAHPMTFAESLPEMAAALRKRLGGRPKLDRPKKAVHIRLDQDVIDKFKATGPGWQTRINDALKAAKV